MRDYTRKAKRINNGEWVIGYLIKYKKDYYICPHPYECMDGYSSLQGQHYGFGDFVLVDKNTICEPTGLTDENGNMIWENDIIKDSDNDFGIVNYGMDGRGSFVIYYEKKKEYILLGKNNIEMLKIEVIGNIFDHPDLLKGE